VATVILNRKNGLIAFLSLAITLLLFPILTIAHEKWVLTPEQINQLNAQPRPYIFTHLTPVNMAMYAFILLFMLGWITLNYTGARELFPDLQVRLASHGGFASLGLRVALFVLLGMAGFGLGPRSGTALFEAPTLAAPDLELRMAGHGYGWVAWVEVALALCFLFGIYVRGAAFVTLLLGLYGFHMYGYWMFDYIGLLGGASIYLLIQGAGSYYVPMPSIPGTGKIVAFLEDQPRQRAQLFLNLLAGANLAYLGIFYKYVQPNLMLAILQEHHVPTFGIQPPTFVLWMALVEGLSGVLIMAGVLMRPLSILLFVSFVFFSAILGEGVFGHIIFYGLLCSFITNGEGRWRRPVATDSPGKIVVLGASFAGVHCAMKLERLLGEFTNATVTLIHKESYFLFHSLLPELVAGAVQPGSIVNPIRRLCPQTHLIQADVASIDASAKKVIVTLTSGEKTAIDYDELVVASDPEANFAGIPGLLDHGVPMMTVGDALFLRQQVLERMGQAELVTEPKKRQALLTFAVVGGGLQGCGTAAEIRELINGALVSYPTIGPKESRVLVFEGQSELLPRFKPSMGAVARRKLQKFGVEVFTGTKVLAVTPEDVVLPSNQRIACRTVVGALLTRSKVIASLPFARPDGRLPVDEFLRVQGTEHILAVGDCAGTGTTEAPFEANREIKMGRLGAYNALAIHRGYKLLRWSERKPLYMVAALGRYATVANILGINFTGVPAWTLSRFLCLLTLPGLERNLRVLADWILDIPFRTDIVGLAPQRTQMLSRAHYEPGDVVVRQGEEGSCAYLIMNGEVEVLRKDGNHEQRVGQLKPGECFGEIALLADVPRTATVRCLTPVDLVVLPRGEFMTLAEGYKDLGNALKSRMTERMVEPSSRAAASI
jgi:NADH dehydrogenase FAD-containing subunit